MKQTTKTLIGLLALVTVAGAIVGAALWAGKDEQKKAEQKEKSEKLFDFDKAKVKTLRLEKDGKLVAALSKDGAWKITEPLQAEGDEQAVNNLLDQLGTLKQRKDLGEEKDAKSYGLERPALALTVKLEDGKEQGLQVGVDNTFDNSLYVRKLGDSTIRVVDGWHKSSYDKSLFDLREKKVAHLDEAAEVRRIEVSGVKTPYALEKEGGKWKYAGAEADSAAADRIQSSIKQIRATAIAAESSTPSTNTVRIRRIVFEGPAGKIEVTRSKETLPDGGVAEESFAVVAPEKGAAKKWKISSALYSVVGLRAAAFEGPAPKDLAKYGLDKPRSVTLLGEKDKVLARVRVGAEKEGKRYALADGVNKLARIEKSTVDDLPWTLSDALETPPAALSLPDGGTAPAQAAK